MLPRSIGSWSRPPIAGRSAELSSSGPPASVQLRPRKTPGIARPSAVAVCTTIDALGKSSMRDSAVSSSKPSRRKETYCSA
jgi:hypothetical protein